VNKNFVVIVAGGQGTRMGTAIPKQFLELCGKPILYHTVNAFHSALPEATLILVLPEQQLSYAQMVLQSFPERIDIQLVAGGETRFHSVQNGLNCIDKKDVNDNTIIFIHDGVRPLVSKKLIQKCLLQAQEKGSVIPAIAATDSMRIMENDQTKVIDRNDVRLIQTPQTFRASVLLPAMQQPFQSNFTDEASVVEANGGTIFLTEGEKENIKITTGTDMIIAEALMNHRTL